MKRVLTELRKADPARVSALLRQQVAEWSTRLGWDRSSFLPQVDPLLRRRRLPGWVVQVGEDPVALTFAGEQDQAATLELAWARPEHRADDTLSWLLEQAALYLIEACPGRRIEVGLFPFGAHDPGYGLKGLGFDDTVRDYMTATAQPFGPPPAAPSPWPENDAAVPRLLQRAYAGSRDAEAGSFYRTVPGCRTYLEALTRGGECGRFAPALSGVVAGPQGTLIGMVLGTIISPGVAHLAQIAVHPGRQGGGLGRSLLEHFRHGAAAMGLKRLTLLATRGNHPAYDWYRRLGFSPAEPFVSYWLDPGPER